MGLGKRIREERLARGWTLERLEELSGVAAGTIHALEQRDSSRSQFFPAIARAFGMTVEGLESTRIDKVVRIETEPIALPRRDGDLVIHQYEAGGAMGHGLVLEDKPPGLIKSWRVDHEWLRLNVRHHTGVHNLRIVTGFGPSMRPMFNPGDPLLLDVGVTTVDHDAVYFFRLEEHGFIKLLQRVPGPEGMALRAKSKNPDYDPFDITPKMLAQEGYFEVFGKILTVWKSEVL